MTRIPNNPGADLRSGPDQTFRSTPIDGVPGAPREGEIGLQAPGVTPDLTVDLGPVRRLNEFLDNSLRLRGIITRERQRVAKEFENDARGQAVIEADANLPAVVADVMRGAISREEGEDSVAFAARAIEPFVRNRPEPFADEFLRRSVRPINAAATNRADAENQRFIAEASERIAASALGGDAERIESAIGTLLERDPDASPREALERVAGAALGFAAENGLEQEFEIAAGLLQDEFPGLVARGRRVLGESLAREQRRLDSSFAETLAQARLDGQGFEAQRRIVLESVQGGVSPTDLLRAMEDINRREARVIEEERARAVESATREITDRVVGGLSNLFVDPSTARDFGAAFRVLEQNPEVAVQDGTILELNPRDIREAAVRAGISELARRFPDDPEQFRASVVASLAASGQTSSDIKRLALSGFASLDTVLLAAENGGAGDISGDAVEMIEFYDAAVRISGAGSVFIGNHFDSRQQAFLDQLSFVRENVLPGRAIGDQIVAVRNAQQRLASGQAERVRLQDFDSEPSLRVPGALKTSVNNRLVLDFVNDAATFFAASSNDRDAAIKRAGELAARQFQVINGAAINVGADRLPDEFPTGFGSPASLDEVVRSLAGAYVRRFGDTAESDDPRDFTIIPSGVRGTYLLSTRSGASIGFPVEGATETDTRRIGGELTEFALGVFTRADLELAAREIGETKSSAAAQRGALVSVAGDSPTSVIGLAAQDFLATIDAAILAPGAARQLLNLGSPTQSNNLAKRREQSMKDLRDGIAAVRSGLTSAARITRRVARGALDAEIARTRPGP